MTTEQIISVYSLFNSSTLDSRDEADFLLNKIQSNILSEKIIIDFSGIDFISRSFADQFHKEKMKLSSERNINIEVANAEVAIIEMLRAVSNTQSKTNREVSKFTSYSFRDTSSLFEYLQAI